MARRLTALVHGDSGAGKSWLFNTAPGPRLLFDAEGRAEYLADLRVDPTGMTPQRIIPWDPIYAIPEESNDPGVVTVIDVQSFAPLEGGLRWLQSGAHPFRSVGLDSLPEVQQRLIGDISGVDQMRTQDWGEALRRLDGLIRDMRDLRKHPTNPLDCVLFVSGSAEKDGKKRPMLQGQMSLRAPYHVDVVGYLQKGTNAEGQRIRYMSIDGYVGDFLAKDNTHVLSHHYGEAIAFPDIEQMLAVLNTTPAAPAPTPTEETA